jgi:DNA-binding response OmpR family regulator
MQAPPPRALVVDDDGALRLLSRVNLELAGFEVREAATIAEAETAFAEHRPDVVLLDLHLAGSETYGLLEQFRGAGVPVAVVTGTVDLGEVADAADAVLAKPFAPQTLVETARRLVRLDM